MYMMKEPHRKFQWCAHIAVGFFCIFRVFEFQWCGIDTSFADRPCYAFHVSFGFGALNNEYVEVDYWLPAVSVIALRQTRFM